MFIIIDSNIIHGRIKVETQELEGLLKLAESLKWEVKIPSPCIRELVEGAAEEYIKFSTKIDGLKTEASNIFISVSFNCTTQKEFIQEYERRLSKYLSTRKITPLPFTTKQTSLEELFENAVKKIDPFDSTGNNFRDAIIWLSIKEFQTLTNHFCLVVTNDNGLSSLINKSPGTNFKAMKAPDATNFLTTKLEGTEKAKQAKIIKQLTDAISEPLMQINIKSKLEKTDFDISLDIFEELYSIDDLEIVTLSPPSSITDDRFLVNADVKIMCTLKSNRNFFLATDEKKIKPKRVGQTIGTLNSLETVSSAKSLFNLQNETLETRVKTIKVQLKFSYEKNATSVSKVRLDDTKQIGLFFYI